jgi:cytochrome P450
VTATDHGQPLSVRWSDATEDPYPLYRRLRDAQPVFYDEANDTYVLTRYDDVRAVLVDHGRFSNVPDYLLDDPGSRISPLREEDPPRHTFLRRIVMPMFTPAEMRRQEPYYRRLAAQLLDGVERGGEQVEVTTQLAIPLPGRVTCDLLGVPADQHERFLELTAERLALLHANSGRIDDDGTHRPLAEIGADLWEIVGPVVDARRSAPEHDAITLLVEAQERHGREQVSDDDIVNMLLHLLTGGFHTTQHLIELLIDLLADRPDLWRRLRADHTLVPTAIEEMLRFDTPTQALRRRAAEDVTIHGRTIAAGSSVHIVYGSANRDERAFDDPDTYSLDRGPTRHMSFSAGIHYCPGAPVSRFEVKALLDELLERYVRIDREGPSERASQPQKTVELMRGLTRVPVAFVRA